MRHSKKQLRDINTQNKKEIKQRLDEKQTKTKKVKDTAF